MDDEIKTLFYDIMQSLNEIDSYFINKYKEFEDNLTDTKTKQADERNLEIIGEAANRIIHGYDTLSDQMIWSILLNNLFNLRKEVSVLLKK